MIGLNKLTLLQAIDGLKNKEFTSVQLVKACYSQINKYNPKINAFITIVDETLSLEQAQNADKEISKFGMKAFDTKPFLGIPYSCKDVFSTIGIQTTAASNILKGYVPVYESTVTSRLKNAGAILIAKDNMDAFGHGGSTEESDFGTTKNPWDINKLPGGSSGGTAAAIASDFVIFGIGEDTGGSIRLPSSWCGITGMKPTYGRVSRYGVIAMCSSSDCPGPMAKNAKDASLIQQVISGKDPLDATSSQNTVPNYLQEIQNFKSQNLKIGKPIDFLENIDTGVREIIESVYDLYKGLGAQIIDVELLAPKYALAVYTIIQRSEVSSNLARFDGIRFGHTRDSFGYEAKKRIMLGSYVLSAGYYDAYYTKAQKARSFIIDQFNEVFKNVDVIICPTVPTTAQTLGSSKSSPLYGELIDTLQLPSSMAGIPSVAFNCGFVDNMPVGCQIMGSYFREDLLYNVLGLFQEYTDFHIKSPNLEKLL